MECDETRLSKKFAYHYLNWDKDLIKQEHSRGVGMFHLTKSAIENRKKYKVYCAHSKNRVSRKEIAKETREREPGKSPIKGIKS